MNMDNKPATVHAGYLPGCVGRIVELHATYYAATAGFGVPFEAKVARELADFCQRFQPHRDGLWLAVADGRIEGSIAIDGLHADAEGAHLRWFILSDRLRGQGMGKRPVVVRHRVCRCQTVWQHLFVDVCGPGRSAAPVRSSGFSAGAPG
jgi:hypothetical protein